MPKTTSNEPRDTAAAAAAAAAASVSEERLWDRLTAMARIGGAPRGGVNRPAFSPLDAQAQRRLADWALARGFDVSRDEAGNLFVRRAGTDPDAAPVLTGSHLDTQPTGGKFDGAYGVMAGFEVLEAIEDSGIATRRPIEVVAWANEEGSRFQPGTTGSAVFASTYPLESILDNCDPEGVSLRDALAATGEAVGVPLRRRGSSDGKPALAAYVEAHIEQGPRLEDAGCTIGVVTGIQGMRRFAVDVHGEEAHAGTTPRAARKDALVAAVRILTALQAETADAEDITRFTVGRMVVEPGSPNTVPGHVHFTIDLRHPSNAALEHLGRRIHAIAAAEAAPCTAAATDISWTAPTVFARPVVDAVRIAAKRQGHTHMDLPSGAGHDAMQINPLCPAGMVFVPCLRGVSHNEAESATPADLAAGTRVLAEVLVALANDAVG